MQIAVEMVSKCIPSDWNVLIKEHPYQLSFRGNGEQGRSTYDYDDFNDMDNVSLVPITTPSVQLIKHAEAVATVTGTAGWEAINMGTPAIIFGNAWYRVCSGTMYVENLSELRDAVQSVVDGMSVHDSDARRFAAAVESIGYRIPKKGPESHHLDSSEIVDRYVEALTEFVEL
jgi:capsule polysaccharide modification protein KpsS